MTVVTDGRQRPIALVGVTEGFESIRRLEVLSGRYFDVDDLAAGVQTCLMTEALALEMFPAGRAVGEVARIGELRLTVVGVFRERVSTFGASEIQRESVLVPFRLLKRLTGAEFINVLYAQASSVKRVADVTRDIGELLKSRHRSASLYRVENLTGLVAAARRITAVLTAVLLVVALLTLMVGGVGIVNVMLVIVGERRVEIGIRKTVGARRSTLRAQFLAEACLMSAAGGLAGVTLAVAVVAFARPLLPDDVTVAISGWSVIAACGASATVGVVSGYVPARRAADLQPVDALRDA